MEQLHPHDPHRIGPYRLLSRLGAGGMGQVYLARSDRGRTVAVKLVHPGLAAREEFRIRFRQEVAAARRVGGEWTAPVLDADTEAATPWFATGYVAGPSLRRVVAHDFGPLPDRSVRILAAGLAHALQDIHRAGIVHRDLKPSNVLITLDGPRVIDFGIARVPTGYDAGPTRAGEVIGSPGFMAPEQIRGEQVTAACDVFCLGAVLAYAATGRLPFGDAEQPGGLAALLLRSTEAEPDLAGVPVELLDLVRDCLHTDPGARPGPAEVLARVGADDTVADGRVLEPWLPTLLVARLGRHAVELLDREDAGPDRAVPAPPPLPPSYSAYPPLEPEPPPRPWTASTALLLAIAAVVAVLSAGTVYAVMSGAEDPRPPVTGPRTQVTTGAGPVSGPDSGSVSGSASASASASALGSASGSAHGAGFLPEAYVGTWQAVRGSQTWRLTLTRGGVGEQVMSLDVRDPGFVCSWTAALRGAPGSGVGSGAGSDSVELDASTVTSGAPPTCTAGGRSLLRLLPDGALRRELASSDSPPLDYRRQ
ncbi:serine/threonine-protein kinase [Streptomyces sp. A0592]|uniref:serine/threonine-protein kinase n=1 Tax=Streptomyces sp. A0592 TaxID=2563099 RepID=UPI00109EDAA4|nr:serine/threonine-protein kinase [Streptomyces sp. A0592]THA83204.1 serine/threonine protein kinase [Streptomyces sp. A0592]